MVHEPDHCERQKCESQSSFHPSPFHRTPNTSHLQVHTSISFSQKSVHYHLHVQTPVRSGRNNIRTCVSSTHARQPCTAASEAVGAVHKRTGQPCAALQQEDNVATVRHGDVNIWPLRPREHLVERDTIGPHVGLRARLVLENPAGEVWARYVRAHPNDTPKARSIVNSMILRLPCD